MKCFMFYLLLLPFAVMAVQGQITAPKRHVLIFLSEALRATTERTISAKVTAKINPVERPLRDQDSDDLSEMQSAENFVTPAYPGPDQSGSESKETSKGHDSYEGIDPKAGAKGQAVWGRRTRAGKGNIQLVDRTSGLVQNRRSQAQITVQGKPLGTGGQADPDSEEGTMVRSGKATQSRSLRIEAERVDPNKSRETSWESSEDNLGKLVHNSKETREYVSSENYPFGPSSLSAAVKSG